MSINAKQLRELVIRPTLQRFGLHSGSAENLLIGTAAAEGIIGDSMYLKQTIGPALGIFQMEPETHRWLVDYLLARSSHFNKLIDWVQHTGGFTQERLVYDLAYMVLFCRLRYLVVPEKLPDSDDLRGLANYWKRHYNTSLGKGTVNGFVMKYQAYVG